MQLKSIWDTENDEEYKKILASLREKFGKGQYKSLNLGCVSEEYSIENGYAKKVYRGKLKEGIEVTPLELSMICDNGYSYFGGSSNINSDGSFTVTIWID